MNIETKIVRYDIELQEHLKFGWKHTKDEYRSMGRMHYTEHVIARDKNMPNYQQVATLENQYFRLKSQKRTYTPMNGWLFVIGLVLFIIPGVLYAVFKLNQKAQIESHNSSLQSQMDNLAAKAKKLI